MIKFYLLKLSIKFLNRNDEKPLATKAMRELEDDKKAMRYEQVVIRIRFKSSNLVLQGFFRPKEPSILFKIDDIPFNLF